MMYDFLPEKDRRMVDEAEKNGGRLYHDYGNPDHLAYIQNRFFSQADLKRYFPAVHNTIFGAKSKEMCRRKQTGDKMIFEDTMLVKGVKIKDKVLTAEAQGKYRTDKPYISVSLHIYDKTDGIFIDDSDEMIADKAEIDAIIQYNLRQLEPLKEDKDILVTCDFLYSEETPEGVPYFASMTEVYSDFHLYNSDVVADVVIKDPIVGKQGETKRDFILLVYDREVNVGHDYDYNSGKRSHQEYVEGQGFRKLLGIELPVSIQVTMKEGYLIDQINTDLGIKMFIENLSKGQFLYYGSLPVCTETAKGIKSGTYTFENDWSNDLDITDYVVKTPVKLYLRIPFIVTDSQSKNPRNVWVNVSSKPIPDDWKSWFQSNYKGTEPELVSTKSIPYMVFQWGCLAQDSLIKMSDGTCKPIAQIEMGEYVLTDKEEAGKVTGIITGDEEELVKLVTVSGRMVEASPGHPISTGRGYIAASKVKQGDQVQTELGFENLRYVYPVPYGKKVYSLVLEPGGAIISGGIYVGDHQMQQDQVPVQEDVAPRTYSDETKALCRELVELWNLKNGGVTDEY